MSNTYQLSKVEANFIEKINIKEIVVFLRSYLYFLKHKFCCKKYDLSVAFILSCGIKPCVTQNTKFYSYYWILYCRMYNDQYFGPPSKKGSQKMNLNLI